MKEQDIHKDRERDSLSHISMVAWRVEKTQEQEHKNDVHRILSMRPRLRCETRH